MSTYGSNSADIDDGSSKQQQSAPFEEITPENEFCLKESSVRKRACSLSPSDTEGGDLERQRLGNFEKIATEGGDNSSIASEDEEDSSIVPEDKEDSSIASEDEEDSSFASEDEEDSSFASEDEEDSSFASENEEDSSIVPEDKEDSSFASEDEEDSSFASEDEEDSSFASEDEEDSSFASENEEDSSIVPEDKEDSSFASEDEEDSSFASEDEEDSSIASENEEDSSFASEDEEDSSIAPEDKKDSSSAPEDKEDSPISSEDEEDPSISSEDKEDSSTSSEEEDYLPIDSVNLSPQEKDNVNAFIGKIVTEAAVDFSNQEIQDIKSAVTEMIERIKAGINERGLFSISRTELCGSMAEETAMWKHKFMLRQPYIEFDFLAVLQATIDIKQSCPECFYVNPVPVNLELLKERFPTLVNSDLKYEHEIKYASVHVDYKLDEIFTRETNNCLASCGCLNVKCPDKDTCSETQHGCDKFTVERPTGTLRVETGRCLRGQCSLIFNWTSKAKTLCTRDELCLPETEKMDNLTIHIDFLPALQLFQSKQRSADVAACSSSGLVLNPTGSEDEHYCFLVAKRCNVCDIFRAEGTWRRSGCRAEIHTIVNKMTDKHRKCYQVLKHLLTRVFPPVFNSYHLKIGVLHHNNSCSDANEDCAKCVFKVLDDLQHAYETRQLKSFHSQANLLGQWNSKLSESYLKNVFGFKEAICSAVSVSDSVSSFIENVDKYMDVAIKEADLNFDCSTFRALPSFGAVTTFTSHKVSMKLKDRSDKCSVIYFLFSHNTK